VQVATRLCFQLRRYCYLQPLSVRLFPVRIGLYFRANTLDTSMFYLAYSVSNSNFSDGRKNWIFLHCWQRVNEMSTTGTCPSPMSICNLNFGFPYWVLISEGRDLWHTGHSNFSIDIFRYCPQAGILVNWIHQPKVDNPLSRSNQFNQSSSASKYRALAAYILSLLSSLKHILPCIRSSDLIVLICHT
jgi:hypothetical protein